MFETEWIPIQEGHYEDMKREIDEKEDRELARVEQANLKMR